MNDVCPGPLPSLPWSSPSAKLLLRAGAPRDAWLQWRTRGIGSSDASAVLGLSRWASAYEVWAEKRGIIPPTPDNDAMELGRLLEPVVVYRWSARTGIPIRRAGLMASRQRPWQLASVDRLAACGGIVEAKTLSYRVAEEWDDGQTPDHAEIQTQHQMAVTGRDHAHVVGLQDGRTWLERTVARDDALIVDLTKIEDEFWHAYVLTGVEPPVDGSAATTAVLNARWPAAVETEVELGDDALQLVKQQEAWAAEQEVAAVGKAAAENQIRALLGDATVGILPDERRITWRRNGTLSTKRLAAAHPDVTAACTRPRPALDLDALKREHPAIYAEHRARVLRLPTS